MKPIIKEQIAKSKFPEFQKLKTKKKRSLSPKGAEQVKLLMFQEQVQKIQEDPENEQDVEPEEKKNLSSQVLQKKLKIMADNGEFQKVQPQKQQLAHNKNQLDRLLSDNKKTMQRSTSEQKLMKLPSVHEEDDYQKNFSSILDKIHEYKSKIKFQTDLLEDEKMKMSSQLSSMSRGQSLNEIEEGQEIQNEEIDKAKHKLKNKSSTWKKLNHLKQVPSDEIEKQKKRTSKKQDSDEDEEEDNVQEIREDIAAEQEENQISKIKEKQNNKDFLQKIMKNDPDGGEESMLKQAQSIRLDEVSEDQNIENLDS